MDQETSQKVLELVAGILLSDNELHPDEAVFLDRLKARFGVDASIEVKALVDAEQAVAALGTLPEQARSDTLEVLLDAVLADGKIAPEEFMLLSALGEELGIGETELDRRLRERSEAAQN